MKRKRNITYCYNLNYYLVNIFNCYYLLSDIIHERKIACITAHRFHYLRVTGIQK